MNKQIPDFRLTLALSLIPTELGVLLVYAMFQCCRVQSCFSARSVKTVADTTESCERNSESVARLKVEGSTPRGAGPLYV